MRALCLASILAAACGIAASEPPLRLALYVYGRLFDGQHGIDRDVVEELARRSGECFDIQIMARARIWADLESGDLDLSVSGIRTPERERFAWFIPYLAMKNLALVHREVPVSGPQAFLARSTLQVGVVRSFRHGQGLDRLLEPLRIEGRVQESPSVEVIFRKLADRRVDAMFSQAPVFLHHLRMLGIEDRVRIEDWTPGEKGVPHGLVLSRRRFQEKDVARWRDHLEAMRRDGTLRRIFRRHLPPAEADRLLEGW